MLRPGWAPVRVSEGGRVWVPLCTCDKSGWSGGVHVCARMFMSPHIPVPPPVTVPTVVWMCAPHCIALHVSVCHGACVHLPQSACEQEWGLLSP